MSNFNSSLVKVDRCSQVQFICFLAASFNGGGVAEINLTLSVKRQA